MLGEDVTDSVALLKTSLNHLSLGLVRADAGDREPWLHLACRSLADLPERRGEALLRWHQACARLATQDSLPAEELVLVHVCLRILSQGMEATRAQADLEDWLTGGELALTEDTEELPDLELGEEQLADVAEVFPPAVVQAPPQPILPPRILPPSQPKPEVATVPLQPQQPVLVHPPQVLETRAVAPEPTRTAPAVAALTVVRTGDLASAENYFAALPWQAPVARVEAPSSKPAVESFRIEPSGQSASTSSAASVNPLLAATQQALAVAERMSQSAPTLVMEDWLALECEAFFRTLPWQGAATTL